MIHIKRDLIISSSFLAACLLALAWFFLLSPGFTQTVGAHIMVFVLGGLGTLITAPILVNFLKARSLHRSLVSGKGVIGRWLLSPEQVADFAEKKRDSNGKKYPMLWRPSKREQREGVEVVFGAEEVCIGGRFLSIPTAGLQSIRSISLDPGYPRVLSISVRLHRMANDRVYTYDERLRIPTGSTDDWLKVLTHYRQALAGNIVVAPGRWLKRIRIGMGLMIFLPLLGMYGWYLASQPDRKTEEQLVLPIVFIMLGILGTIGAGIVVLISWQFRERQYGGRKR